MDFTDQGSSRVFGQVIGSGWAYLTLEGLGIYGMRFGFFRGFSGFKSVRV